MIPTSVDFSISTKSTIPANVDAVIVLSTEGKVESAGHERLSEADRAGLKRLATGGAATGKAKEVVFDLVETAPGKLRRVYSVGLGQGDKVTGEIIRQASAKVLRALRHHRLSRAAIVLPGGLKLTASDVAEQVATGALLAAFDFEEYKGTGRKKEETPKPKKLDWTIVSTDAAARKGVDCARAITDGQNFARTIASRPGNNINPPSLAKAAQEMAREMKLGFKVLDEKQMKKLGMGGILAVGSGSIATPPRMIALEYRGNVAGKKGNKPLLVIGKSITFDSGGISIKPADKMGNMIYDKCGGMAVLGMMVAIAKLKLPVHVVGILSSAENVLSSQSYRPGDKLRMYNGVTVDVTNTDAEGRLVLGDALAWGIETYKPAAVVDLATLTGGVVVALGKTMAGIMSNSDELVRELTAASEGVGEKVWRLPIGEDQRDQIRGDHADIVNSAGREASPLQGAAFLSFFVPWDGSVPWAHIDIAGVADTEKELPYYAKGPTGWGVRTLVKWIEGRAG